MKNIAYIVNNLKLNGIGVVVMNHCRFLDKKKYNITIYTGSEIDKALEKELHDLEIKIEILPNKKKNLIKYITRLKSKLKSSSYDIVCIHANSHTAIIELIICKLSRIKNRIVYAHSTGTNHKFFHLITTPIFNKTCSKVIACSKEAGQFMSKNNYYVISNGIDTKKYIFNEKIRQEVRKRIGFGKNDIIIGHVGNFNKSKNHKYIIELFEKIKNKEKEKENYKLLLVGDGQYFNIIKKLASKSKYSDDIVLYGSSDDCSELYNAMDVFIFPSLFEGLGLSLIEAEINGLYSICSENIPEEAIFSKNCIKRNLVDQNEWIESIKGHKKRINVQSHLYDKFDIKNSIVKLDSIYNQE